MQSDFNESWYVYDVAFPKKILKTAHPYQIGRKITAWTLYSSQVKSTLSRVASKKKKTVKLYG